MSAVKRLLSEYKRIKNNPIEGIKMEPRNDDVTCWDCYIEGPKDCAYHDGIYHVEITASKEYPFLPPKARFLTPIFHPNIHLLNGEVCLDVLKSKWSPVWGICSICEAIQLLLTNPDPTSPLNCDAANLLKNGDNCAYESMVELYRIKYA